MKTDYLNKVERGGYNQVQQDTTITSVDDVENILEKKCHINKRYNLTFRN